MPSVAKCKDEGVTATRRGGKGETFTSPAPNSLELVEKAIGGFHLTHRHASKKIKSSATDKVKKLICCRRVIHKQRVKATRLCAIS